MIKRTLKGFVAGIALVVALLSTSIEVLALEKNYNGNINNINIALAKEEQVSKNNITINANVKIKEGLDVILENTEE